MPFSKVKNLLLLILLLVNLTLLALVVPQRLAQRRQADAAVRHLENLFASYGLTLESGVLPDQAKPLTAMELEPDSDAALTAAKALLGDELLAQDGEGRLAVTYDADGGRCTISRGGQLTASLTGTESSENLGSTAKELLRRMKIDAASVSAPVRRSAGVYELTAVQRLAGEPVFSASLVFSFRNSMLRAVDGTVHLTTGSIVSAGRERCISCNDALVAFLASRDTLGWVGGTITGVEQGYVRAETASAAVIQLTPGWLISTDTGSYWINGLTRDVCVFKP